MSDETTLADLAYICKYSKFLYENPDSPDRVTLLERIRDLAEQIIARST